MPTIASAQSNANTEALRKLFEKLPAEQKAKFERALQTGDVDAFQAAAKEAAPDFTVYFADPISAWTGAWALNAMIAFPQWYLFNLAMWMSRPAFPGPSFGLGGPFGI